MKTDTWFNKKTELFEWDTGTYKALVPINFFSDKSLNGHFGLEFKVKEQKASVVIVSLEDNPGVDVNTIMGMVSTTIYANFLKHFNISDKDILWAVNRPIKDNDYNLSLVNFKHAIPVVHNGEKIMVFMEDKWKESNKQEFQAVSQLHLI